METEMSQFKRDVEEMFLPKDAVRRLFVQNSRESLQLEKLKSSIDKEQLNRKLEDTKTREKLIRRIRNNSTADSSNNICKSLPNPSIDSYIPETVHQRKQFCTASCSLRARSKSLVGTDVCCLKHDLVEFRDNRDSKSKFTTSLEKCGGFCGKRESVACPLIKRTSYDRSDFSESKEEVFNFNLEDTEIQQHLQRCTSSGDKTAVAEVDLDKVETQRQPVSVHGISLQKEAIQTKEKSSIYNLCDLQAYSNKELENTVGFRKLDIKRKISLPLPEREIQPPSFLARRMISLQGPLTVRVGKISNAEDNSLPVERTGKENDQQSLIKQRTRFYSFQNRLIKDEESKAEHDTKSTGLHRMFFEPPSRLRRSQSFHCSSGINTTDMHSGGQVTHLPLHTSSASLAKVKEPDLKELESENVREETALSELLPPLLLPRIYEQERRRQKQEQRKTKETFNDSKHRKHGSWLGAKILEQKNETSANDLTTGSLQNCRYLRLSAFTSTKTNREDN